MLISVPVALQLIFCMKGLNRKFIITVLLCFIHKRASVGNVPHWGEFRPSRLSERKMVRVPNSRCGPISVLPSPVLILCSWSNVTPTGLDKHDPKWWRPTQEPVRTPLTAWPLLQPWQSAGRPARPRDIISGAFTPCLGVATVSCQARGTCSQNGKELLHVPTETCRLFRQLAARIRTKSPKIS